MRLTFYDNKKEAEELTLPFYERKLAIRGVDFDEYPEDKADFVRYVVELRCLNPIVDTKRSPLPPLEDLVEAAEAPLILGLQPNKELRLEMEKMRRRGRHKLGSHYRKKTTVTWACGSIHT